VTAGVVLAVLLGLPGGIAPTLDGVVIGDPGGVAVPGAVVTLSGVGPNGTTTLATTTMNAAGLFSFNVPSGSYSLEARDESIGTAVTGPLVVADEAVTVTLPIRPPAATLPGPPLQPVFLLAAIGLSVALFARIHRNELLDNAVRLRVFEHGKANPGRHHRGILKALGLPMGVLTYPLNTLERGGYVTSRQDGARRRFYPKGHRANAVFFLSAVQERIVLSLRERGAVSQAALADHLAIAPTLVKLPRAHPERRRSRAPGGAGARDRGVPRGVPGDRHRAGVALRPPPRARRRSGLRRSCRWAGPPCPERGAPSPSPEATRAGARGSRPT
jgi:hypothetical protein